MTVIQLGQFVPQHFELHRRKSVVGLSSWTLFYGSMYTYLTMLDVLVGHNGQSLDACGHVAYPCFIHFQPTVQAAGAWALLTGLWYWYLRYERLDEERRRQSDRAGVFFSDTLEEEEEVVVAAEEAGEMPPATPDAKRSTFERVPSAERSWSWRNGHAERSASGHSPLHYDERGSTYFDDSGYASLFFRIYITVGVALAIAAVYVYRRDRTEAHTGTATAATSRHVAQLFADGCGYASTLLCAVMWIPQIVTTFTYGHRGSLSLLWVLATLLSDVLYSMYMSGMHMPFSVWANNIPDGLCALVLLVLVTLDERRDRRAAVRSVHDDPGERLPLVREARRGGGERCYHCNVVV
ncbi:hypothetical protein CDCA_CDCA04G1204 [Cyanidium caldarium]|uniref:Uncharacterized protein n=1 Tax=Cyanidium caldarium TaxID=2771 RepID=A0AAV9ISF8_CYACA|nr:hypothetical protein CDCA_CDCA04G1204 [Cyanidium caldarium]